MMPPPPGYPPPGFGPPPPPQRGGRSFTRAIFVTLAAAIFGFSLLLNFYLILASGVFRERAPRTQVLVEGDPTQKIVSIPLNGAIMGDMPQRFDRFMTLAERDEDLRALVIEIDSPGGTVTGSDEIYFRIRQFKAQHPEIPVIVSMGSVAASGGYYVACAGDYIYAQRTTLTGNIGVMLPRFNLHRLLDRWGIEETTIEATGANFKNAGSMFRPEDPADRAYLQKIADEIFDQFKQVVAEGRGEQLTRPLEQVADGRVFMAEEALELGLIDQIGYARHAYDHAAGAAGLTDMHVIRFLDPPTLLDLLRAESSLPGQARGRPGQGVTINGVNVDADMKQVAELLTPRFMYLWKGD